MARKILLVVIIILYIAFSVFAAFVGVQKILDRYSPSDEVVQYFTGGQTSLVIEDSLVDGFAPPLVRDGEVLLPFDIVREYIDPTVFLDTGGRVVTVTSPDKVIRMNSLELESYVNMEPVHIDFSARYIDNVLYMPVEVFKDIFGISVEYNEEHDVVIIDFQKNFKNKGFVSPLVKKTDDDGIVRTSKAVEKVAVRSAESEKAPLYRYIQGDGEDVTVYEINGDWARIRTAEGIVGFVETRFLTSSVEYNEVKVDLIRRNPGEPDRIVLAWQYIYNDTPPVDEFISSDEITVYSPTWFTVTDAEGNMESRADMPYVDKVGELGAVVWPLVNNTFNDIEMTSAILNNPDARDNIIRQLMAYAQFYDLDGYNIDFENIYLKDRDAFTQFIRELMPYARKMGLIITVDVGIPNGSENYSQCYDHSELSKTADYIALMTYDQHWASSPVAGSQAQLSWVEEMIKETLLLVDPDRLILGIPFYTRIWKEEDGQVKNVMTYGMERVQEIIQEKSAYLKWDEESGQYYGSYYEDGAKYMMWIEDPVSAGLKAGLSVEYGLRGVAVWQLSLGNEDAWKSIGDALDERGRK